MPQTNPVSSGEIDGFSKVVTLVEAGVVSTWKCHHNFTGMLVGPHHLTTRRSYTIKTDILEGISDTK